MKITVEQAMNRLIPQQKNTSGIRQVKQRVNVEYIKSLDENDSLLLFKKNDTYVLSPADDELDPIIGEFDEIPDDNSVPPSFMDWMNTYSDEIRAFQECDGIQMIDLGLPSGTKWANMNIGAKSPEERGDYYAWGEVETKDTYTIAKYKYYDASTKTYTKLGDIAKNPEYDVAYKINKGWCMPTLVQAQELIKECKWEKVQLSDVTVWRATGPNGNSIDFPFNGCISESSKVGYTYNVYIWLSNELSNGYQARSLKLLQSAQSIYNMYKRSGAAIRPVLSGEPLDEEPNKNQIKLVDLGLSVDWADMNLGAENPEDGGDFYAWGETEPKNSFSWTNYKWNDSVGTTYKSKDLGSNISKKNEYDPAYLYNENMCLPTSTQWQELLDKCTWTYTQVNNKNVYKVVGPNGNSILIPLSGYKNSGTKLVKGNTHGCYMSDSIYSSNTNQYSRTADFESTSKKIATTRKMVGRSIRAISTKVKNTRKSISPFMPFKWGQGAPWNNALPIDPATNRRSITGCGNTSMAQILAYYGLIGVNGKTWRRTLPATQEFITSKGTKSQQTLPELNELYINYDLINHYKASEFTKDSAEYKMIGLVMKQLGYMNKSDYHSSATSSGIGTGVANYKNLLHLSKDPKRIIATDNESFSQQIYNELEKGYPVNVFGFNETGVSGHAFICDGYNAETDKFHFNWGWDGNYDGWFSISLLNNINSYDLSYSKQAIIDLHPEVISLDVNQDGSVTVTDAMIIVQDTANKKPYDYRKDVNQDGKVDHGDVQIVINHVLGR